MAPASSPHTSALRGASINNQSTSGSEDARETLSPIREQQLLSQMSVIQSDHQLVAKIDQLYKCGVDEQIDLPLLIVAGGQSSGKSSVLSALTRLPFPQGTETCTRFPTKVVLRYAVDPQVSISIKGSRDTSNTRYEDFAARWTGTRRQSFSSEVFQRIIEDAHETMQLKNRPDDTRTHVKAFSGDVLQIEIDGPTEQHFSVIDLPGIFLSPEEHRTDAHDVATVENIVNEHIQNPRSLILAVVSATEEPANQAILGIAKKHDKDAIRTLGIVTKPDLMPDNIRHIFAGMFKGERHPLGLGWNVVVNSIPCSEEAKFIERDDKETSYFAREEFWRSLDLERQGITKLRERLRALLLERVNASLPGVRADIEKKLQEENISLTNLGDCRITTRQQRKYLHDLSQEFQSVVSQALDANHNTKEIFKTTKGLELAKMITQRNHNFVDDLERFGHHYEFQRFGEGDNNSGDEEDQSDYSARGDEDETDTSGDTDDENGEENDNNENNHEGREDVNESGDGLSPTLNTGSTSLDTYERGNTRQFIDANPDRGIEKIIEGQTKVAAHSKLGIEFWLQELVSETQGLRLDGFSSRTPPDAMKEQSCKWGPLARGYISDIIQMVQSFIKKLLGAICLDKRTRDRLLQRILDHSLKAYEEARRHVDFLLVIERERAPNTYNSAYYKQSQVIFQQRGQDQVGDQAIPRQRDGRRISAIPVGSVANHRTNRIQHNAEKLHDVLHAYYKVALPRFVDNVCMQAASFHLHGSSSLEEDKTPLRFFSPSWVVGLEDEELRSIAGEDEATGRRRRELEARIKDLERAIEILGQP